MPASCNHNLSLQWPKLGCSAAGYRSRPVAALSQINARRTATADFPGSPSGDGPVLQPLLKEIRQTPLLWMLVFVPAVLVAEAVVPHSHTLLFVLAVLAIVPLAALLSHATEAVAAKTGDAVGGLLNATLGNLTELIIAITALRAGQYMLVKAP
jgi:Ca2+:H+ antiporter